MSDNNGKQLTFRMYDDYNKRMKKIVLCVLLISSLGVAACGVKSDLEKPNPSFPREYPVY